MKTLNETDIEVIRRTLGGIKRIGADPRLSRASKDLASTIKFRVMVLKQEGRIARNVKLDLDSSPALRSLHEEISRMPVDQRLRLADYYSFLAEKIRSEVGM